MAQTQTVHQSWDKSQHNVQSKKETYKHSSVHTAEENVCKCYTFQGLEAVASNRMSFIGGRIATLSSLGSVAVSARAKPALSDNIIQREMKAAC